MANQINNVYDRKTINCCTDMTPMEFDIINEYFMRSKSNGDDAAILHTPEADDVVTSTDTSVEGQHFTKATPVYNVGYKTLAVSISDMAAMGARPTQCLLNLSLPSIDNEWLKAFSRGFFDCATEFNVELIGGDTTKGPRVITTTLFGLVAKGKALMRHGAKVGDHIYISGPLGNAAYALHHPDADQTPLIKPTPRVALGQQLIDVATSCIDISDGLLQDLGHILESSQIGAIIESEKIPRKHALNYALCGGDDYELCFTSPLLLDSPPVIRIGHITKSPALLILDENGDKMDISQRGFQHF